MHMSWKRMLVNMKLSEIGNTKIKALGNGDQNFNVSISNNAIFLDLKDVFSKIDGYKNIYLKIFEDMSEFNFIDTSSVTDNGDDLPSIYGSIFLYEHTMNSFKCMFEYLQQEQRIQIDLYLLIALLHDFGKSHSLCEHYGIKLSDSHCIRSAKYFKIIIENNNDDSSFEIDETSFNIIYKTIYNHHSFIPEEKQSQFLEALIIADRKARKIELDFLEAKRDSDDS